MSDHRSGVRNARCGERGEDIAEAHLKRLRYRILGRNFRCKGGEIDIIAQDGKTYVFVEVKTRKTMAYGVPQLAVTPFKQRQISKAALTWLLQEKLADRPARFDVIAVLMPDADEPYINHIQNAFDLSY